MASLGVKSNIRQLTGNLQQVTWGNPGETQSPVSITSSYVIDFGSIALEEWIKTSVPITISNPVTVNCASVIYTKNFAGVSPPQDLAAGDYFRLAITRTAPGVASVTLDITVRSAAANRTAPNKIYAEWDEGTANEFIQVEDFTAYAPSTARYTGPTNNGSGYMFWQKIYTSATPFKHRFKLESAGGGFGIGLNADPYPTVGVGNWGQLDFSWFWDENIGRLQIYESNSTKLTLNGFANTHSVAYNLDIEWTGTVVQYLVNNVVVYTSLSVITPATNYKWEITQQRLGAQMSDFHEVLT